MANILRFYICSVLLAVIAGHSFLFTEGRQLKAIMQQNVESFEDATKSDLQKAQAFATNDVSGTKEDHKVASPNGSKSTTYEYVSSLAGDVNTFQPTSPGNSPGVGHSHVGLKEVEQTSLESNTLNGQPMGTGHSPGVGHWTKDAKVEPIS